MNALAWVQPILMILIVVYCVAHHMRNAHNWHPYTVDRRDRPRWIFLNWMLMGCMLASAISLGRFWALQ